MGIATWNPSASLNTTLGGKNIGPGMARSDVNDSFQQIMADVASDVVPLETPKKFGAVGDGTTNDGAALSSAAGSSSRLMMTSNYANTNVAVTLPFGKTMYFLAGAKITNSGTGTTTFNGVTIREGYNPGNLTSWTGSATYSFEGLSVDFGGYGPRAFGPAGTPTAINGSINIPSTSTIANHATGVSGYVKSASVTTGGVGVYSEANRQAASVLVWGLNTVTKDNNFSGANVWGAEIDLNIDNVGTTALGVDVVGGSTVEPTASVAVQVQAIGVFASPKKRWQYGFRTRDAAAIVGLELGAVAEGNSVGSQPIQLLYRNGSGTPTIGLTAQVSGAGDATIAGGGTAFFVLKTLTSTINNILLQGDKIGFFNAAPVVKPTVTGSKGGNAALGSLLTALASLGLITDSSS